jgi:hypothetical protein
MQAIVKLRRSGMTTAEIASGIGDKSGGHLVRAYERGERFPSRKTFACMVELAESRGLTFLARDFLNAADKCETDS